MPSADPRLKSWPRRRIVAALRAQRRPQCEHPVCLLPGVPIDYDNVRSPAYFEVDEIQARTHGGDPESPYNIRPTHRRCNRAGGAAITNSRRTRPPATTPLDAEDW